MDSVNTIYGFPYSRSDPLGVSRKHGCFPDVIQAQVQHAYSFKTWEDGEENMSVAMPTAED